MRYEEKISLIAFLFSLKVYRNLWLVVPEVISRHFQIGKTVCPGAEVINKF